MIRALTFLVPATVGAALLGCAGQTQIAPAAPAARSVTALEGPGRLKIATSDWTPQDPRWEARLPVTDVQLTADTDGCVILRADDGRRIDVVWPAGFTAEQTDQGPAILDPHGNTVLRSGSLLDAGGGTSRATGAPCIADRDAFYVQSELAPLDPS